MVCSKCGNENRPGARFCKHCGAVMEQPPPVYSAPPPPPPPPPPMPVVPADRPPLLGRIAVLGGLFLVILGALGAGAAFFFPWFTVGGGSHSGLDTVTLALDGGDMLYLIWGLAPLGALGLLVVGGLGLVLSLFGKKVTLWTVLLVVSGTCGCSPLGLALLSPLWDAGAGSFDEVIAGMGVGFWGSTAGLGVALVGAAVALIGGLISRR